MPMHSEHVHVPSFNSTDKWAHNILRGQVKTARLRDREIERERTRISNRHNGSAPKVACTRRSIRPLVVAVEGVWGVRLQGIRKVAETWTLNRCAVCQPRPARVVQRQLERRLAGTALTDAPRGTLCQVFCEKNCQEKESNQEHFALRKKGAMSRDLESVCVYMRREYWKGRRRNEGCCLLSFLLYYTFLLFSFLLFSLNWDFAFSDLPFLYYVGFWVEIDCLYLHCPHRYFD